MRSGCSWAMLGSKTGRLVSRMVTWGNTKVTLENRKEKLENMKESLENTMAR